MRFIPALLLLVSLSVASVARAQEATKAASRFPTTAERIAPASDRPGLDPDRVRSRLLVLGASFLSGVPALLHQEATPVSRPAKKAGEPEKPGVSSWTQYRGDLRNRAVSYSERPAYGKTKWKYFTGDRSTSSPAVAEGKVIVTTETGRIHAIDAETGKKAWVRSFGVDEKKKGFVISSPLILDGRIYVGDMNGRLHCISLADGEAVWAYQGSDQIFASPKGDSRGIVFGSKDGWITCLDPVSGDLKWKHRALKDVGASAGFVGNTVLVPSKDKWLYRFDFETGEDKGRIRMPGGSHCSPTLAAGYAFMVYTGRKCGAIDLFRGEAAWTDVATSDIKTSCAYSKRKVIVPLGRFVWCMNAATGEKHWEADASGRVGTPVINGDEVVFCTGDGVLRVHSMSDGTETTRIIVGEDVFAAPTVCGGDVYVAGLEGHVYAID